MAGKGEDGGLKYQRIAEKLRSDIANGRYGPGDRLPGENDLMAAHNVARMTARQALGVLQSEGLAEARRGAGVFVRVFRPLTRRGVRRLAREWWGSGRSIRSADTDGDREVDADPTTVEERPAPEWVAALLGLSPGAPVWTRTRRFVLDGKPVLLSTSYLPADLVADSAVTCEDSGPGGIYARLRDLGHEPVRFREEIRSRMPTRDEARRLSLPGGTPVILLCRTAHAADGRTVEVNEMVLDSAAYTLEYEFDA